MKAPLSWLKDYVDINVSVDELAAKLVGAGFEIEEVIHPSDQYVNIKAVKILSMEKHPNADKLQICQVDAGDSKLQIVTAAKNVAVGDVVALALDNSRLPDGTEIKKGELRGVLSEGMFCGGSELKLTAGDYPQAGIDGVFIFPEGVKPGTDINDFLGTNDVVFDISVTANRPDCNSVLGIAREIAAVLRQPMKDTFALPAMQEKGKIDASLSVEVRDTELCPRYLAKMLDNVVIAPSDELIKRRLRLVGLRPINNIVDITNYILFDIGQPMHAFDYNYIKGGKIVVRRAEKGEKIVTLDGTDNALSDQNLVIANAEEPMAVAGVMGGENSGINDATTKVVFEFARFKRDNVRKTARMLGLHSDSSARFEKGIDYVSQDLALIRTMQLVSRLGAGSFVGGKIDSLKQEVAPATLCVKKEKIDEILGIDIPTEEIVRILSSLQFGVTEKSGEFTLTVPAYREDIVGANDIAEEVIRLYGYDNIVGKPLDGKKLTQGGRNRKDRLVMQTKAFLSGFGGLSETFSYSFVNPKFMDDFRLSEEDARRNVIRIMNPLSEDVSVMRTTLTPSLFSICATNYARGVKAARFYEIGKTYFPKAIPVTDTAIEKETLALAVFGEKEDFFSLKSVIESLAERFRIALDFTPSDEPFLHPYRQAFILVNGKKIGYIGEMHPAVTKQRKFDEKLYVAELDLDVFFEYAVEFLPFVAVSKFPSIERDLALVVKEDVYGGDMLKLIYQTGGAYLRSATIFDVYSGLGVLPGKKSVAFNLLFRKDDGTLDGEEVNSAVDNILKAMSDAFGAKLRD
ncbi:MAG TPA: phenylalanine--tRNA ligase subunit beta [Clostridiales bacterium]|nr:phenylalanine--tRNA ligase subunit beta [Clostridiales bacterium]